MKIRHAISMGTLHESATVMRGFQETTFVITLLTFCIHKHMPVGGHWWIQHFSSYREADVPHYRCWVATIKDAKWQDSLQKILNGNRTHANSYTTAPQVGSEDPPFPCSPSEDNRLQLETMSTACTWWLFESRQLNQVDHSTYAYNYPHLTRNYIPNHFPAKIKILIISQQKAWHTNDLVQNMRA